MKLFSPYSLIKISVIFVIASISEVLSIVSLGPVLTSFSGNQQNNFFSWTIENIFGYDQTPNTSTLIVIFACINCLNLIVQLSKIFAIRSFIIDNARRLDEAFFESLFITSTYKDLGVSKSELLSIIAVKIDEIILRTITPALNIVGNILVICLTIIFLILLNPLFTFYFTFVVCVFYFLNSVIINKRIQRYGQEQSEVRVDLVTLSDDVMENWKQIYNLSLTKFFRKPLIFLSYKLRYAQASISMLASMPRYFLELILIIALASMFIFFDMENNPEKLTILIFFIFAAVRILPQAQQLFGNLTVIKGNREIYNDVQKVLENNSPDNSFIEFNRGQSRSQKSIIFEEWKNHLGITLKATPSKIKLDRGEVILFTGPSGIGKTTLFETILGVRELNANKDEKSPYDVQIMNQSFTYTPQTARIFAFPLWQNITLSEQKDIDLPRLEQALYISGLNILIDSKVLKFDAILSSGGHEISGGQRQRIMIARSIYHSKGALIFDESFSALDVESIKDIFKRFRSDGNFTLLVVSHDTTMFEYATQKIRIHEKDD